MRNDETTHLLNILKDASLEDIDEYASKYLTGQFNSFPAYMDYLISKKKLKAGYFSKGRYSQKVWI